MTKISRRSLIALAGAAGASTMLPAAIGAQAAVQTSIKIGEFEISTFSDGFLSLPAEMFASGIDTARRAKALASAGQAGAIIKSPLNVTLVRKGENLILIDVGSGTRFMSTAGRLAAELEGAGIDPQAITHVIYTHAHPDHLWGTVDDFDELSFPNAAHYISQAEWNFWMAKDAINRVAKGRQSFVVGAQRSLTAIKDRIKMMKPGQDVITGLHVLETYGHTPGHVSVQVGTGADRVIVLGDALTHPVISFQHPDWRPANDQVPEQAIATRQRLLAALAADRTRIIGYHLPPPGLGYVEKKGSTYRFVSAGSKSGKR
jgi:glyoxylase-like metal-dependent hydrolase (beta-lactamase superfamily II)